jgi:hypothetical protein
MKTIEDLMVGEEAGPQVVVGEALVQGVVDRCEDDARPLGVNSRAFAVGANLVEDVLQSLCCFGLAARI